MPKRTAPPIAPSDTLVMGRDWLILERSNGQIVLDHAASLADEGWGGRPDEPAEQRFLFASGGSLGKNLAKRLRRVRPDGARRIAEIDERIAALWRERGGLLETLYVEAESLEPTDLAAIVAARARSFDARASAYGAVHDYNRKLALVESVWPAAALAKATKKQGGACSLHGYAGNVTGCPGCERDR